MAAQGILYTVKGRRGSYFAIHDPATRRVWTERTERAARLQAEELGIEVVSEEIISHEQLLTRTGRDAPAPFTPFHPAPVDAATPVGKPYDENFAIRLPLDDTNEPLMIRNSSVEIFPFAAQPLAPDVEREAQLPFLGMLGTGQVISSGPGPIVGEGDVAPTSNSA